MKQTFVRMEAHWSAGLFLAVAATSLAVLFFQAGCARAFGAPQSVRLGVLEPLPGYNELTYQPGESDIVKETVGELKLALPDWHFDVRFFSPTTLAEAVCRREVDFALMSSGQFVELSSCGVYPLASLRTARYPNPNQVSGALFIVRSDRDAVKTIADMKGLRVAYNFKGNFINHQIPRAAVAQAGFDPDGFFSTEIYTGNRPQRILELLLEGRADVGVFRVCELEALEAENSQWKGRFRAVRPINSVGEACQRSTELFPGWTMTVTAGVAPELSRKLTQALLSVPDTNPVSWSIATEFDRVNEVLRLVKEGPYAYLREWTLKRVLSEYGILIAALCVGLVFWVWHWLNVERLAQARARELERARLKLKNVAKAHDRAQARLAALSRIGVLSGLSSIFAHEMGQPLAAIGYRLQAVKSLLKKPEPDRNRMLANLEAAEAQNERAGVILERVRSYAKGRISEREAVRLDLTLENAIREIETRTGKSIKVGLVSDAVVLGDELELRIALLNLLKNAVEAADAGKAFQSYSVRASLAKKNGNAIFTCENSGFPVDSSELGEYVLGKPSLKEDGTGLGLLIVRSVARSHGGSLKLEAKASGGIVARLELPLESAGEHKHAQEPQENESS